MPQRMKAPTAAKLVAGLRRHVELVILISVLVIAGALAYATGLLDWLKGSVGEQARELVARYGLPATFVVMLLAGTALPMASPLLVAFCSSLGAPLIPLVLVASSGYTLGLATNYALGRFLGLKFVEKRVSPERYQKLSSWLSRWGFGLVAAFGLLPATPLETLSLICGAFRVNFPKFTATAFAAKLLQFSLFAFLGSELAWLIWG